MCSYSLTIKSNDNTFSVLPKHITKQIHTCENSEQYVTSFLQNTLPSCDVSFVTDELRKSFLLAKHKTKLAKKRRCKGKLLSSKKRMQLGLRKIGCRNDMKYMDLLPMNELWLKYMQQVLGTKLFTNIPKDPTDSNWETVNQQLIKADFHGAEISVVASKCPSLVGMNGIVVQDTKNTFRICGKDNVTRTIPKESVVINIHLNEIRLEFFGQNLCIRPTERTTKKLKGGRMYEL